MKENDKSKQLIGDGGSNRYGPTTNNSAFGMWAWDLLATLRYMPIVENSGVLVLCKTNYFLKYESQFNLLILFLINVNDSELYCI